MFLYKILKTEGLDESAIKTLKDTKNGNIIYFYHPTKSFFEHLRQLYKIDIQTLFYDEKEAKYQVKNKSGAENIITLLLLYPKARTEEHIERMVNALIILKFQNTTFIITEEKEEFILHFLENHENKEMTDGEGLVGLVNAALEKMSDDARKIRDEITAIETSISTSGPIRPIFNDLLQLKKHLITLTLTYDSDDKLIEFFKREKDLLHLETKGENGTIQLEESLDTLKKLVKSYDSYLGHLDVMITNLSSFQLNAIMKTLTEISIVLTIPTIIYGFWGVNVKLPFEGMAFGFLLVLAVSLIISGVVWFWMRRMKFL